MTNRGHDVMSIEFFNGNYTVRERLTLPPAYESVLSFRHLATDDDFGVMITESGEYYIYLMSGGGSIIYNVRIFSVQGWAKSGPQIR